jgi:hypothetical protein
LSFNVEVEIFVHIFATLSIKHCKIDRSVRKSRSKNHVLSECLSHPNSFKMEASLSDTTAPHIPEKVQLPASPRTPHHHRGGAMGRGATHGPRLTVTVTVTQLTTSFSSSFPSSRRSLCPPFCHQSIKSSCCESVGGHPAAVGMLCDSVLV